METIESLWDECPVRDIKVGIAVNPDPSVFGGARAKLVFVVDGDTEDEVYHRATDVCAKRDCPAGDSHTRAWPEWTKKCEEIFPGSVAAW